MYPPPAPPPSASLSRLPTKRSVVHSSSSHQQGCLKTPAQRQRWDVKGWRWEAAASSFCCLRLFVKAANAHCRTREKIKRTTGTEGFTVAHFRSSVRRTYTFPYVLCVCWTLSSSFLHFCSYFFCWHSKKACFFNRYFLSEMSLCALWVVGLWWQLFRC